MKHLIVSAVLVLMATSAWAGDDPFSVRWKSGVTQPFDTSSGVTASPAVSEGTACVWVISSGDDIYFTLDGTKPVAATVGGNGTVISQDRGVALLPDEAKRLRFTGGGSSAGWVTYRQYDGWIEPW